MARFPGEAGDASRSSSTPGSPRGSQIDLSITPREARRAPRARPHGRTDGSSGNRAAHAPALDVVAQALADAFLAAPTWALDDLQAAGWHVVGLERAFVGLAARAALDAYDRPPRHSPRGLAGVVARDARLASLFRDRERVRPVRIVARRVEAVRRAADPPIESRLLVDTVPELARALDIDVGHLLWLADTRGWNRRAPLSGPLHHYRYEWRERPGRTPRLLEKPMSRLSGTQRVLLHELLALIPVHEAAHGFVSGRSALTGASRHVGREIVITADLTSFFSAVRATDVYAVFRRAGYAEPLAHLLTGVCTHRVPTAVLASMPPGGTPDERFRLRRSLAEAHLPQGAPSSPALANLSLAHLDRRLTGLAARTGSDYTRYADDLAFSGGSELASRAGAVVRAIDAIVSDEGHTVNPHKTRVMRQGVRQSVTGVVVNEHTAVGRREHDLLKATLHNCVVSGPDSQNRDGHPEFRAHLSGRVGWVEQVHPARGARLRAQFDRIIWTGRPPSPFGG